MSTPIEQTFEFCPRCGVRPGTAGTIPFRCSQCDYTMFFGPVAAVGGLVTNPSGQLLLVRRARDPGKGRWGLPGGFVDRGETVEAALAREILEETKLRVTAVDLVVTFPNQYVYRGVQSPVIDLFYQCQVSDPIHVQLEPSELDGFEWIDPTPEALQTFLDNMAFDSNRKAIVHWLG